MKSFTSKGNFAVASVLLMGLSAFAEQKDAPAESDAHGPTRRLSVVGLLNLYSPSVESTNTSFSSLTSSSKVSTGLGVLSESSMAGFLNFEWGLLLLNRQNTFESSVFSYAESTHWLTLPVGIKIRFLDLFAVGAGPYFAYRVGDISNGFSTASASSLNFSTTSQERFELGLQGSAGATLPINENLGVVIEARILKGVSNLSGDSATTIRAMDVIGLAGIQFSY